MKRILVVPAVAVLVLTAAPALAGHNADDHSSNVTKVATFDHGKKYRQGSDLAFWGDVAVLGNYDNPGGFRLVDISDPAKPSLMGQLACPGAQNDVSIWEDLVFVSVDSPRAAPTCGAGGASQSQNMDGSAWEGIRVISIADPKKPAPVAMVRTDCGSHTHTLVPDLANNRVLIYVLSYPLGAPYPSCNGLSHRKISVVEVPLADPAKARVIATPDVSPAIGCHDVTVLVPARKAAAACLTESQIWDISDPVNPVIVSHVNNPAINIHHSSAWSWDAKTIVIGDELAGAEATPGCFSEGHAPIGALWFYDVSDPASPQQRGYFQIPQRSESTLCTAHNFNIVPLASDRDVLVSGWYNGGTTVIDFTDPSAPEQLGYYIPLEGARATSWSSYWYNGYIYANNFDEDVNSLTQKSRGFDVFRFDGDVTGAALRLSHLNAQTQEALPEAAAPAPRPNARVLGARRTLPGTGTATPTASIAVVALAAAAALRTLMLRGSPRAPSPSSEASARRKVSS